MGTHPIFESDFDCLTVQSAIMDEQRRDATKYMTDYMLENLCNLDPDELIARIKIFQSHFSDDKVTYTIADNIIKIINDLRNARALTRSTLFLLTLNLCYECYEANPPAMRSKLAASLKNGDAESLNC